MSQTLSWIARRKYELLLAALIQHLFIGIFLQDLPFYARVIWPVNMLILGLATTGIFMQKAQWKQGLRLLLLILLFGLPLILAYGGASLAFMQGLSLVYVFFYAFVLWEIMRFLLRPGYINADLISAAACGYFLLIEIGTFLLQYFWYCDPHCFKGIDHNQPAAIYMDLVYFCSITVTSIGFGDILPNTHQTKLVTALFGIAGQLYAVILVGILISKYSAQTDKS